MLSSGGQGCGWASGYPGLSGLCEGPIQISLSLILVLGTFQSCSKSTLLQFSDDRHIFELIWSEVKGLYQPKDLLLVSGVEELNLIGDALRLSNILQGNESSEAPSCTGPQLCAGVGGGGTGPGKLLWLPHFSPWLDVSSSCNQGFLFTIAITFPHSCHFWSVFSHINSSKIQTAWLICMFLYIVT